MPPGAASLCGGRDPQRRRRSGVPWHRDLHRLIDEKLGGHRIVVVSKPEPYLMNTRMEEVRVIRPASGMATALDPVMRACGGTWVAHGGGDADRDGSTRTTACASRRTTRATRCAASG